ncbi:histidine decarboxylase, partial [Salmonella enterica]|nr:histidine decarboxylase [Salmonella enterica]
ERFMRFSINNCGDWADYSNYPLNTFSFEKEVIEYFADIFKIDFNECWGYVTNGGTEGNMFGCYLGREIFPDGTLYYSKDTHYSVAKIVKLLRIKSCLVDSQANGEIDYDDLMKKITTDSESAPIIFANIGTTVRGAIDDISVIQQRMADAGFKREDYYIHADAALSGMILPFVDDPQAFTFSDGIDSIGVSGHKMIGSPIPCGIAIAKKKNVDRISVEIDYIAAHDKTITGSRNGITPLMMWEAIKGHSYDEWKRRITHSLSLAQYAVERFKKGGIPAWRNKNSITVVFPRPSEPVWQKHCLAISGDVAHLIATAHNFNTDKIDALIDDVIADKKVS